jgi:hypothetical protein
MPRISNRRAVTAQRVAQREMCVTIATNSDEEACAGASTEQLRDASV